MNRILAGSLAGLIATVPMTMAMRALHRRLPPAERYPLPPRLITDEIASKAGVDGHLDESERRTATLAAHYGYGAAIGGLYGPLAGAAGRDRSPVLKGVAWGLAVWTASYLGWLPAAGILPPATEQPARRNALMIAAHVVWGAAAGVLTERFAGPVSGRR
jgi:hypothetical protein